MSGPSSVLLSKPSTVHGLGDNSMTLLCTFWSPYIDAVSKATVVLFFVLLPLLSTCHAVDMKTECDLERR